MISEERLAQLRFQAANNGYTPQRMGAMRKAGTVPEHATVVTVIPSELIQLVGAYDQLQVSMRAYAAAAADADVALAKLKEALSPESTDPIANQQMIEEAIELLEKAYGC